MVQFLALTAATELGRFYAQRRTVLKTSSMPAKHATTGGRITVGRGGGHGCDQWVRGSGRSCFIERTEAWRRRYRWVDGRRVDENREEHRNDWHVTEARR